MNVCYKAYGKDNVVAFKTSFLCCSFLSKLSNLLVNETLRPAVRSKIYLFEEHLSGNKNF